MAGDEPVGMDLKDIFWRRVVGATLRARLSKLETQSSTQCGSAAPTCGKPLAFRPISQPRSSSEQAGRLSLPACSEEVLRDALREGRAFPQDRRRSRRSSPTGSRAIWTSLTLRAATRAAPTTRFFHTLNSKQCLSGAHRAPSRAPSRAWALWRVLPLWHGLLWQRPVRRASD